MSPHIICGVEEQTLEAYSSQKSIKLKNYKSGLYLYKVLDRTSVYKTGKFIKK